MSVICSAPGAAPAASSGIQTRSGATGKPEGGHKLLVKGAAECLLGRSTHVSACALAITDGLVIFMRHAPCIAACHQQAGKLGGWSRILDWYVDAQLELHNGRNSQVQESSASICI